MQFPGDGLVGPLQDKFQLQNGAIAFGHGPDQVHDSPVIPGARGGQVPVLGQVGGAGFLPQHGQTDAFQYNHHPGFAVLGLHREEVPGIFDALHPPLLDCLLRQMRILEDGQGVAVKIGFVLVIELGEEVLFLLGLQHGQQNGEHGVPPGRKFCLYFSTGKGFLK